VYQTLGMYQVPEISGKQISLEIQLSKVERWDHVSRFILAISAFVVSVYHDKRCDVLQFTFSKYTQLVVDSCAKIRDSLVRLTNRRYMATGIEAYLDH
jgi:hypothetical protein